MEQREEDIAQLRLLAGKLNADWGGQDFMAPALARRIRDFQFAQEKRRKKYGDERPWGILGLYEVSFFFCNVGAASLNFVTTHMPAAFVLHKNRRSMGRRCSMEKSKWRPVSIDSRIAVPSLIMSQKKTIALTRNTSGT